MANHHRGQPIHTPRQLPYKSLAWLIGTPLTIMKGIEFQSGVYPDGTVRIIEDYPKTILLEMEWIHSTWGLTLPPRKLLMQIPKASLACGDVVLKIADGRMIHPDDIADYGYGQKIRKEDWDRWAGERLSVSSSQ